MNKTAATQHLSHHCDNDDTFLIIILYLKRKFNNFSRVTKCIAITGQDKAKNLLRKILNIKLNKKLEAIKVHHTIKKKCKQINVNLITDITVKNYSCQRQSSKKTARIQFIGFCSFESLINRKRSR